LEGNDIPLIRQCFKQT